MCSVVKLHCLARNPKLDFPSGVHKMNWPYIFSSDIWPASISAVLIALLGWYIWRRRDVPGARPLAIAAFFGVLWIIGFILESVAVGPSAKIFWFAFQGVWQLPLATAIFCFVLQYAGLGRWLTRRNLLLLSVPSILVLAIILTNGQHHLMWQGFEVVDGTLKAPRGTAYWATLAFAFALALVSLCVFIWLFIRSPRHRWPVALMFVGQIINRTFVVLDSLELGFPEPFNPILFMFVLAFIMYAIALFRFHIFDPTPLARVAALEQMTEGMLVLDLQGRVVYLNPTAAKMLGKPEPAVRGRALGEVLPANPVQPETAIQQLEITLGTGNDARHYNLNLTPLADRSGELLGQLILLHDITEQKRTQACILEQQSVVATLQERERLARELHDGIGQVLGYVGMQAQTARKWMQDGNTEKADSILSRLVEVAKDAHADVRESILNLKVGSGLEWSFLPTLKQYLDNFQTNYGIRTEVSLSQKIGEETFSAAEGVQLLRVIQEAMTNARKHGGARTISIAIEREGSRALINITDDGCGFDPGQLKQEAGEHFGMSFMRERMAQIGGSLRVDSRQGTGTVVRLSVPIRNQSEGME